MELESTKIPKRSSGPWAIGMLGVGWVVAVGCPPLWVTGSDLPEGLVHPCSSPTHQQLGPVTLSSPHFTPAHSGMGAGPVDGGPGLRAMSAGAPGEQDGEATCPSPAWASSHSLCDEGPQRAWADLSTSLVTLVGVQHDCAQWPAGGDPRSPLCLPGARGLPEVALVTKLDS